MREPGSPSPDPVRIGPITTSGRRVSAEVDGATVGFESDDVDLCPAPEAFVASFLVAAQLLGRPVAPVDPLDAGWADRSEAIAALVAGWWGAAPQPLQAEGRPVPRRWARRRRRTSAVRRALCFTGGVDSFHTLLTTPDPVDVLVLAIGYDIDLDDRERAAAAERTLREVAAQTGARAVVIRTDLLRHPLHVATNWELVHGGPLAALGMLLGGPMDLLVSSSFTTDHDRPWGTHWDLDPLWSTGSLCVTHVGHQATREEKVAAIARTPLALDHLRVCWAHLTSDVNCGRCDKCLETMVMLHREGALDRARTFPPASAAELAERIDQLDSTTYRRAYRRLLDAGLEGPLDRAVRSVLRRTDRDPATP